MPSTSYQDWRRVRAAELDEIAQAHTSVGGTARGRRYSTQQINRSYAMLLASHFQGFCRDLHSECVKYVLRVLAPPPALWILVQAEFTRGRHLDRGNAQPSSLGADFGRLGINLWNKLKIHNAASEEWNRDLDLLNEWRNAIAHQDFTSPKLGGIIKLQLVQVQNWRATCGRLARAMDEVMRGHLQFLAGASPW